MLKTMECVLVEIQCHHDKCERGRPARIINASLPNYLARAKAMAKEP